jgi:hypothetical protein
MRYGIIISFFSSIIIITACHKKHTEAFAEGYYQTETKSWKNYLKFVGVKNTNLNNLVLLIARTTDCPPCLKELSWWNKKGSQLTHSRIVAIVIAKYSSTFKAFVNRYITNLTVFQDSSADILKKELIPAIPIKLYFNDQSKLVAINKIGAGGELYMFVKKVRENEPPKNKNIR